ncbi:hypothetical protein QQ045_015979 [Rhodiola kirilowii]
MLLSCQFFPEYNSQLLESSQEGMLLSLFQLLGGVLLHPSNVAVMIKYVSSLQNMRIMMNLLRDSNKSIQLEASHVFKLFLVNQNKPPEVVTILVTNRSKLIRFFNDFNIDKEDAQFEADKAQLVKEIAELQPRDLSSVELEVDKAQIIKEAAEVQLNDIEPVPEKAHEVYGMLVFSVRSDCFCVLLLTWSEEEAVNVLTEYFIFRVCKARFQLRCCE